MSLCSRKTTSRGSSTADADHFLRGDHGGIAEDVHGLPAARPLSLSVSRERFQSPSRGADSPRKLSMSCGEDARSPRSVLCASRAVVDPAATERGGGSAAADAALLGGCGAGSDCLERKSGNPATASSASEVNVTHSGPMVPRIHGIPLPGELPSEKAIVYAEVREERAPQRLRMAAKGAFSNVTSLAVLQRVQSRQVSARQVETAGWAPVEPSPMRVGSFGHGGTTEDEFAARMEQHTAARGRGRAATGRAAGGARVSEASSPFPAPHGFSGALLMPSKAMMTTEKSEEDAVALAAAQGVQQVKARDDADEGATRSRNLMEQKRQHPQQPRGERGAPLAHARVPTRSTSPPTPPCNKGDDRDQNNDTQSPQRQHRAAPAASAHYCDSMENIAPSSSRTAASARRSLTCKNRYGRPQYPPSAYRPDATPASTVAKAAANAGRRIAAPIPRGFENFIEKGQARRAAEAAGGPWTAASEKHHTNADTALSTGDRPAKCVRRMSVVELPRGYEMYVRQGQSRRAKAERLEEERRTDDIVNCTHHPRVNRHKIVSASSAASARTVRRSPHPQPRTSAAAAEDNAPTTETLPLSVFERLTRTADERDQRLLPLEERCPTSHQWHSSTPAAAEAATANGHNGSVEGTFSSACKHRAPPQRGETGTQRHTARGSGRNVFENLYAQAQKGVRVATAASARPERFKVHERGAASGRMPTVATSKLGPELSTGGDATAEVTAHKKSQAEIEQHLSQMMSRQAEHRAKWEKQMLAHAADEKAKHGHVVLNRKTDELAERARARYRAREKQAQPWQEQEEAQGAAAVTKKPLQRSVSLRWAPQSPKPVEEGEQSAHGAVRGIEPPPTAAALFSGAASDDLYKHQRQAQEHSEEELSECTFRPRVNKMPGRMTRQLVVESFQGDSASKVCAQSTSATMAWEEVVGSDERTGSVPQLAEYCGSRSNSPLVGSHSGSPFRERSRASPPAHYRVPSPSEMSQAQRAERGFDLSAGMAVGDDYSRSNTASTTYGVHAVESLGGVATTQPRHSSGPLAEQLRGLEEMLSEWKEIERESSPIITHPCNAGVAD
ncbi:hypothetical protein, conserved [Leishmania tarentolae]|uniref:Uncharacterized protein n=1 Tax=Leishmania tarentolae TaxID=5689 RepID=A0A640K8U4_LEITA|nr:hypothetical protein, conserved [Leishmania tarentolae]